MSDKNSLLFESSDNVLPSGSIVYMYASVL